MARNSFRKHSKVDWEGDITIENINAGSLQRIADAAELMASNYIALQNDRDYYKRVFLETQKACSAKDKRINSLRGVITRLKRKQS